VPSVQLQESAAAPSPVLVSSFPCPFRCLHCHSMRFRLAVCAGHFHEFTQGGDLMWLVALHLCAASLPLPPTLHAYTCTCSQPAALVGLQGCHPLSLLHAVPMGGQMHVADTLPFAVQSGLHNLRLDNPIPCYSEVERRVSFNRYACGINFLIRSRNCGSFWFGLTSPDCTPVNLARIACMNE
jgi:hypothetical protein